MWRGPFYLGSALDTSHISKARRVFLANIKMHEVPSIQIQDKHWRQADESVVRQGYAVTATVATAATAATVATVATVATAAAAI